MFCFILWYLTFPFSCWFSYQKVVPPIKMEVLPWDAAGIASHFKLKKINTFNLTMCVTFLLMIWKCHKNSVYLFQEYSSWKLVLHHQAQGIGVNQGYAQLSHCVNLDVLKSLQSPHCIRMHLIANKWVVSWMPKPKCVLHWGSLCQVNPGFPGREGTEYITAITSNSRSNHNILMWVHNSSRMIF